MTNKEFVDRVTGWYGKLLSELARNCVDVQSLSMMLSSGRVFDVKAPNRPECFPFKEEFNRLEKRIDRQDLSAEDRAIIEGRIKQLIKETIDELQNRKRCRDVDDEITKPRVRAELIRSILADVAGADANLLTAGLGVLVKDLDDFIANQDEPDCKEKDGAQLFLEVLEEVAHAEKKVASKNTYKEFKKLRSVPTGIAKAASKGVFDLNPLLAKNIVTKPATSVGRKLLKKFMRKLKHVICDGPESPYSRLRDSQINQAALPTTIATTILTVGFSAATFWYPLAVYISLLIARTSLETYCDKK